MRRHQLAAAALVILRGVRYVFPKSGARPLEQLQSGEGPHPRIRHGGSEPRGYGPVGARPFGGEHAECEHAPCRSARSAVQICEER